MAIDRRAMLCIAVALCCAQILASASCGVESRSPSVGLDAGADSDGVVEASPGDDGALPGDDGGGGLVIPDGSGPCSPATGCPSDVLCGRYVDPCTGSVFLCGSPCPSGQVCASSAASPSSQSCQPKSCVGKCGVVGVDSCGVGVSCGGCAAGYDCVGNACVTRTPREAGSSDACSQLTCMPSAGTQLCGTINDGCGHTMQCSCGNGQQCSGGVCGPVAPECNVGGVAKCGSVSNACGSGNVACGGCTGATKCQNGVCTPCSAPVCGAATCGSVGNGCGPAVSCGKCNVDEVCDNGGCCAPMTCGAASDAGLVSGCAAVDLGCGLKKSCQPCPAGETCVNGACAVCTPKTCADFGNAGCGHSDGCGGTLNCCGSQGVCQGTLCCGDGEVSYNGSCCLPMCDTTQPSGPQISCGQTIFCGGGGGSGSSSGAAR